MAPTPAATPAPLPAVTRLRKPAPQAITGIAGTRNPPHRVASSNNDIDDRPDRIAGRTGVPHNFPRKQSWGKFFVLPINTPFEQFLQPVTRPLDLRMKPSLAWN